MTDVMRRVYRELSNGEKTAMLVVKNKGAELYGYLGTLGESRELAIAKTKLEEVVRWATKHITG